MIASRAPRVHQTTTFGPALARGGVLCLERPRTPRMLPDARACTGAEGLPCHVCKCLMLTLETCSCRRECRDVEMQERDSCRVLLFFFHSANLLTAFFFFCSSRVRTGGGVSLGQTAITIAIGTLRTFGDAALRISWGTIEAEGGCPERTEGGRRVMKWVR